MRLDHSPFFRTTVGFDRLLDLLDQADGNAQGYPPYNIERSDENHYRVILAVAGFAEKELDVEVEAGVLTVAGRRQAETGAAGPSYLHQGIAGRTFERKFQLAEHVEVRDARLENGLLRIDLERIVPEEKKPRKIAINASNVQDNGPRTIERAA
jgi:molecular chaperone IbpA